MIVKMHLKIKTGPSKEPIAVDEAKQVIGLSDDQQQFDGLLLRLIKAATMKFENETNMRLMEQTWYQYEKDWPIKRDYIEIRYPPLSSVTSVKYTDSNGDQQTWTNTNYIVEANLEPGRVQLGYLKNYPTGTLQPSSEAIVIEFVCGWADVGMLPDDIKLAIELMVTHWFANREQTGKLPDSVMSIINNRKVFYL
jgi:uncharacterized phiE125 gp8 family phage protein